LAVPCPHGAEAHTIDTHHLSAGPADMPDPDRPVLGVGVLANRGIPIAMHVLSAAAEPR
jgi:hypothetical protein